MHKTYLFVKVELWSILTLSYFFVHLECCQYRQKRQKSVLPTPCHPLFKICTLLTSMGQVLNLLLAILTSCELAELT